MEGNIQEIVGDYIYNLLLVYPQKHLLKFNYPKPIQNLEI